MPALATAIFSTLLITSGWASMCPDADGMTDEIREEFLKTHNMYRSQIAKGEARNAQGGHAPKAARMLKMTYDCDIEANTMQFLKKCVYTQSSPEERNNWGQNIWMTPTQNFSKISSAYSAVSSFFGELGMFGVPNNLKYSTSFSYMLSRRFTQLAWQNSDKIGCGVYWCNTMTFAACEYSPAGNQVGSTVYEIGDPCAEDSDCHCDNCVCIKDEALCLKK